MSVLSVQSRTIEVICTYICLYVNTNHVINVEIKDAAYHPSCSRMVSQGGVGKEQETVIETIKYADDVVLMVKEEDTLQDVLDWLLKIGRHYGMESSVGKSKVMNNTKRKTAANHCEK